MQRQTNTNHEFVFLWRKTNLGLYDLTAATKKKYAYNEDKKSHLDIPNVQDDKKQKQHGEEVSRAKQSLCFEQKRANFARTIGQEDKNAINRGCKTKVKKKPGRKRKNKVLLPKTNAAFVHWPRAILLGIQALADPVQRSERPKDERKRRRELERHVCGNGQEIFAQLGPSLPSQALLVLLNGGDWR